MQLININELTPHPRNTEFFDDMTGEKWEEFLESVMSRQINGSTGIIEPLIITQNKMIVSGHQRLRAAKALGIKQVPCEVVVYQTEDDILKDLIEINIRQRGDIGGSAKKVGLRIKELERIYGIERGNNQCLPNNSVSSQSNIASQMGISVDTLQNYKLISEMIPELSDLVDTGIVTKTTALAMMKNLSEQEQEDLIASLDTTKRITQKEVQKYIDEINELKSNSKQESSDYQEIKKSLEESKSDYNFMKEEFNKKVIELQELRKQMESMKNDQPAEQFTKKLKDSSLLFCSRISTFIEQVGGYVWLTDHINEIPELERSGYLKSVQIIKDWADQMEYNINNNIKEKE